MHVRKAHGPLELEACLRIRRIVFIDEQGVPEHDELDELDPACTHFLALLSHKDPAARAIGTARLLPLHEGHAKVQRVAVLSQHRRHGAGAALMGAVEAEAARAGHTQLILGSQLSAQPFYERLGWEPFGDIFLDAGIEHRAMRKRLAR